MVHAAGGGPQDVDAWQAGDAPGAVSEVRSLSTCSRSCPATAQQHGAGVAAAEGLGGRPCPTAMPAAGSEAPVPRQDGGSACDVVGAPTGDPAATTAGVLVKPPAAGEPRPSPRLDHPDPSGCGGDDSLPGDAAAGSAEAGRMQQPAPPGTSSRQWFAFLFKVGARTYQLPTSSDQ